MALVESGSFFLAGASSRVLAKTGFPNTNIVPRSTSILLLNVGVIVPKGLSVRSYLWLSLAASD